LKALAGRSGGVVHDAACVVSDPVPAILAKIAAVFGGR